MLITHFYLIFHLLNYSASAVSWPRFIMARRHIFAAIILQALLFVTAFGTEDFTESPTDLKRVNDGK